LSVGDWWEFRSATSRWRLTVVERESDHYVLVRTSENETGSILSGKIKYHADLDGWITKRIEPDGTVKETGDKYEWVHFPLGPRTSWSFRVYSKSTRGSLTPYTFECSGDRWESLEIGNKKVRTMKILCQSKTRTGDSYATFSHTGWYAPDAKRLVKLDADYVGAPTVEVTAWNIKNRESPPLIASPAAPKPLTPTLPPVQGREDREGDNKPNRPAVVTSPAMPAQPAPAPPVAFAPSANTEVPKIAVNYPPPDTKVERDRIVITGLVTHNIGVDRVQIAVNGVEVPQQRDIGTGGKSVPIRASAPLEPGDNVLEITATDKAGNMAQAVRTVTRVMPATAAVTSLSPPKVANRWAVVIGIGEYENKAIPRLRYAAKDAQAMYDFLTTKGGYPKQNVVLLTDTTPEKPTLQNIRRALGDFLFRRPARDDMVLIFYAGHGAPEVDAAGNETDGLSKYLIPRNADPDSLYSTAFPMDEVQKIFARIPAERVVMLLDTCYSGTAGGRTFARQQIRSGNLSDQFLERLTRSRGRVVITASGPNEVALESTDLAHGIFTYYLLEGLAGKADRNGDGIVTVSELYEYVEDKVDRKSREAGGRQRPLMKGEIEGTLPLSRLTK